MRPLLLAFLLLFSLVTAATGHSPKQPPFDVWLTGTIGSLPIRLHLVRDGERLRGEYFYETNRPALRTVLSTLSLDGTVDEQGRFTLTESVVDAQGNEKRTGTLTGTLTGRAAAGRAEGTWSKPDGSGKLPLVAETVGDASGAGSVVARRVEPKSARLRGLVDLTVPRLDGGDAKRATRFNTAVDSAAAAILADFEALALEALGDGIERERLALEVRYEVAHLTGSFASVVFRSYVNLGGAYPTTATRAIVVDLGRGETLELRDVVRDTRAIALQAESTRRAATGVPGLGPIELESIASWYVTRHGLVLVVEVAHAAGDVVEIYLPAPSIAPRLTPVGERLLTATP